MCVLVLVTNSDQAPQLTAWGMRIAHARKTSLQVLCWAYSPTDEFPLLASDEPQHGVEEIAIRVESTIRALTTDSDPDTNGQAVDVQSVLSTNASTTALQHVRRHHVELLIAGAEDLSGAKGGSYATNPLLRQSPCYTLVVYADEKRTIEGTNILVAATDSPHDSSAVSLAMRVINDTDNGHLTVATIEDDTGEEAVEVGHRILNQILRNASVEPSERVSRRVFFTDETFGDVALAAEENDVVLVSPNNQSLVEKLMASTTRPTVAVVKQAPPLRPWSGEQLPDWVPRLNPADYADLVVGLRRGSQLGPDFTIMLGLASAIATLGLLQDSPAVVIGSMLLAPLMTPMIAGGLALAQANAKLARTSFASIFTGFLLTLAISYIVGLLTPGNELTQQVISRSSPNLLDLMIALFSAIAASYALARPNLIGAVAGVAIATALVPPLCSVGIAIAYGYYLIAVGAAVLFVTNVVAIICAAAATFRAMGVTTARAAPQTRRWVYQVVTALGVVGLLLAIPLTYELRRQIDFGRPQPLAYPLPKSVIDALTEHLSTGEKAELMLAGRSSTIQDEFDVAVWLSSQKPLPREFADDVSDVVRNAFGDPSLKVEVRNLIESWESPSPPTR